MKEVKELMGLGNEYKIIKIEEEKIKGKTNKLIYVECIKEKEKCIYSK